MKKENAAAYTRLNKAKKVVLPKKPQQKKKAVMKNYKPVIIKSAVKKTDMFRFKETEYD